MTKSRIRAIRATAANGTDDRTMLQMLEECLAEVERYQKILRRGDQLTSAAIDPEPPLLSQPAGNVKKKARGTIEEFRAYATELGLPSTDGEAMFLGCEEKDWKGIKDWKARMRRWKLCGYHPSQSKKINGHAPASQRSGPATCIL